MHTATLLEKLQLRYLDRLLASPRGRAHLLSQLADAEANGEGGVFDRLLARVDDPELRQMISRHAADEVEHARLFRACIPRTGITPPPVPDHLKMIDRLDAATFHLFDRGIQNDGDVMKAYVLLQVVEERALEQFAVFEDVMRKYDAETADVIERIARDEERHLRYCKAISKRYAPDAATLARTLQHYREVEARVFADNGRANMQWTLDHDYLAIGRVERLFWRAIARLNERNQRPKTTRFAGEAAAAA